ncbi:hypothetical protein CLOACE_19090 [Clostridium acetireducens DSM 10703]|uniref:YetF C-terminal domain-containing protein n=1 Tax=Clostridium acetireducens DSM 10703 TaxID=1121290 RepID=A0A1E8EWV8_9CLOT|nr:DUF421 domain-containing protein [Clostridium acetireducens]OFI05090.1 hypothetical protein CLOACE_19090 [Clostridium acetireducens DSM 10703]
MFISMFRTLILYSVVLVSMRIMGKKQIGQLEPFELAVAIMISELASLPMQDPKIPIMHGIIPIITLLFFQVLLSIIQLKSEKARILINGKPNILINHGEINIDEMKEQKYNINDLMEELRLKGYHNINDIEFAILESSGQISIIPKLDAANVTRKDLNIKGGRNIIPVTLILDGKLNIKNLNYINKSEKWLYDKLKENKISSAKDVFIAYLDSEGNFHLQKNKNERGK